MLVRLLLLDVHWTTHQSNIGIQWRKVTEWHTHTLDLSIVLSQFYFILDNLRWAMNHNQDSSKLRTKGLISRPNSQFLWPSPSLKNMFFMLLYILDYMLYIVLCQGEMKIHSHVTFNMINPISMYLHPRTPRCAFWSKSLITLSFLTPTSFSIH